MKLNPVLPILAAAALTLGAARAPAAAETVDYSLSPVFEGGAITALQVTLKFRGEADGSTVLQLPDKWASEKELYRYVRDLRVEGVRSTEMGADAGKRVLTAAPGAPITVSYRVVSGFDQDPTVDGNGNPFKPIIRPSWFFVYGEALFAYPESLIQSPARFHWKGPGGVGFASDLEHLAGARPGVVNDVAESVVIGGRGLRTYSRTSGGAPLRVAVVGEFTAFSDTEFTDLADRIISAENGFWGGHADPFLIALAPIRPEEGASSLGGTGRSDAFALTATSDTPLAGYRYLLAHEHFHTWNPAQLGGMYEGAREPAAYWFSEGFTDFYARQLMLRTGFFSLEEFASEWNAMLTAYDGSSALNKPNEAVVADFWTDYAVQKLPYQRGALLAVIWDQRLRQATGGRKSLDDVMRRMRELTLADKAAGRKPALAPELFPRVYREMGGPDLAADIERYVVRGETILLPEHPWGRCAGINTVTRAPFARGWDADATTNNGNVVTGLQDDSPAYRAGIRNGMQIVKREFGEPGDSTVEYGLRIKAADGTETVYRFMPTAPGPDQSFQTLAIREDMTDAERAACVRMMGGG
jgi:predicted metalloprotease with PDZ domain